MTENNISVIKFEENSKVPTFKEVKGKDWVSYGEKNDYPDYLLTLFNRSAKHNAIVTGKVHYIVGNGFVVQKDGYTIEQVANIENFIKELNDTDSIDELLYKVSSDLEIFAGFALQVIPNKTKTGISEIYHIDFSKIRIDKSKSQLYYCNDWANYRRADSGFVELKPFDPNTFDGVYYYTQYRPGIQNYPLPEYIGAIPYIEMDYEISNFHLKNIKNGFSAGTMLSFNNGEPSDEARGVIEKRIKDKYTGSDKAGQLMITFSDGKDSAPTVVPLTPNNFDKLFDTLNQTVQQEIFTGHKVTSPMLFGVKTEGQLGGRDEYREAFELFQNGYVNAKQKMIENEFNYLFDLMGLGKPLKIQQTEPINFQVSEQTMQQVLTKDEIREKLGYPALGGDQPTAQPAAMRSEFHSHDVFKKYGVSKENFEIIKSSEVENSKEADFKEIAFHIQQSFDKKDDDLIPNGKPNINNPDIPTKVTEKIRIMYSYEVRKGYGPEIIDTTRDFCRTLLEMDKLYSRDDIDKMTEELGYDVFVMQGGYYHNPKTDVTERHCRHIWNQNLVRSK